MHFENASKLSKTFVNLGFISWCCLYLQFLKKKNICNTVSNTDVLFIKPNSFMKIHFIQNYQCLIW